MGGTAVSEDPVADVLNILLPVVADLSKRVKWLEAQAATPFGPQVIEPQSLKAPSD